MILKTLHWKYEEWTIGRYTSPFGSIGLLTFPPMCAIICHLLENPGINCYASHFTECKQSRWNNRNEPEAILPQQQQWGQGTGRRHTKLSSVYSSLTVHTLENTMRITKIPYFSIGFIYFLKFGISTSSFITAENHQIICFRVITDEGNADRLVISAIKEHWGKYFGVSGRVWKNLCWRRCTKKETAPHRHSLTHEVTYKLWIAMQAILKLVCFEIWPILVLTKPDVFSEQTKTWRLGRAKNKNTQKVILSWNHDTLPMIL